MSVHTQVVRPAGAGHETLWVLLAAAVVLALAALVVGVRAQPAAAAALAAHQVDARTQLNAAEQGVHADLLVAAEEIAALRDEDQAMPTVERLRELGLPPFAAGPDARARGAHEWRVSPQGQDVAFVGRSAEPQVAASLLLRLPARQGPASDGHTHGGAQGEAVEIWIQREGPAAWPDGIDDPALVRQGWRQIVTRYDAGVTRKDAAH
jgi:hypothetical protein